MSLSQVVLPPSEKAVDILRGSVYSDRNLVAIASLVLYQGEVGI